MTQSCPPQPQVSVIVPVYNQERYLEECISSIRRQTLAEWECLIINDGSSDSSGEIARRFSEADSRIRYFEQKNRGVSSARNLGMRRASGRYLCFVDGDDFIDAAFLKHLLDASDRGASDLTVAGKLFCDRFPPDKIPALPTCGIFLRREFPLKNNLEFPEGIHPCEDGLFSHFVLALTEKISFCPEAVYHYRQHEQGNHHQIRKRTADILPMIPRWLSLIDDGSSDSSGEIARRFSEADSRIRYFEQKNRGVSSARNLGMRRASGRYLCFVDGDDFIDAAFLKHLLDASDRGASDLTVAGKLFCDRFPPDKIPALPTCGIFLRREFPLKNNLEFPEGIHPCEDGLFSHFVLALTEKISFCPEAVYHYRQHEQGNHHQIRKRTADILPMIPRWLSLIEEFYEQRHLWKRKAGHLVRFIEHEPFELRLLGMPFSPPEQEILYSIIRDFLTAHCTAAECRRASLHLPFRLLLQSSGFSDFGRRLRRAGKNTGIRRKLLHFCPVPSWRRNGRAQLRQVREQLEEIRRNITF